VTAGIRETMRRGAGAGCDASREVREVEMEREREMEREITKRTEFTTKKRGKRRRTKYQADREPRPAGRLRMPPRGV
jgi:hypothetical protein